MAKNFFISTAIHYSSGLPHIGHAYENIIADVIARYKRLIGYNVFFSTGLDEHGQKIAEIAEKNKYKNPQEWVDYIYTKFKDLWGKLNISNDGFVRTTDSYHIDAVQDIFSDMYKNNDIYKATWNGLYCVGCEESYTKDEAIEKSDGLYCRVGHKLINKEEPSYFFKMSKYKDWIKNYFILHPDFTFPSHRMVEMSNNFLDKGLEDLSISRTNFVWGIQTKEDKDHVIYVWLDALFNYVTVLGFKQKDDSLYKKFWKNKNSEILHVVGKDIVRFHTIYWPIMLESLKMRKPSHIIGHGWIMAEDGRKMSKSFGNVIDPNELIDKYGSDMIRYYFVKEIITGSDHNFSESVLVNTFNSDLANIYGNLVSRTIGMIHLYSNGIISEYAKKDLIISKIQTNFVKSLKNKVNKFDTRDVLISTLDFAKEINKYIENSKPWNLFKDKSIDKINTILITLVNAIKAFTIVLQPVLIDGTKKIIEQMNFTNDMLKYKNINHVRQLRGLKVNESSPIYKRISNN
ncbi:MAG: methionine--tRNA ligase [Mycoplasmoidaceae bacterium]|nr:MAG: methionine--tRNA ligase [Mycoplasmoidaceae bacterium]